jgi:hypothetical protein
MIASIKKLEGSAEMGNRPMTHHRMTSLFTRNGFLLPGIVLSYAVEVNGMRGVSDGSYSAVTP